MTSTHPAARHAAYADRIEILRLTAERYDDLVASPFVDDLDAHLVVIESGEPTVEPGSLPVVVAALGDELGAPGPRVADVVVGPDDLDALTETVAAAPRAAVTLAVLLRGIEVSDTEAGLAAESTAYSLLQGGAEFAAWRAAHPASASTDDNGPTVSCARDGDVLTIALDRPRRHNAISAQLRDDLHAALQVPLVDDDIEQIVLRGNGPSFSTGGDLDEFGRRPDPITAHHTRLLRSPARLIDRLRDRLVAQIHGWTLGGGIEMAAFAGRVVARADTRIGLPETRLGLLPGAGGTVSISRRCGRQRTAALALTGATIGAERALAWGLVDEITQ